MLQRWLGRLTTSKASLRGALISYRNTWLAVPIGPVVAAGCRPGRPPGEPFFPRLTLTAIEYSNFPYILDIFGTIFNNDFDSCSGYKRKEGGWVTRRSETFGGVL